MLFWKVIFEGRFFRVYILENVIDYSFSVKRFIFYIGCFNYSIVFIFLK